MLNQNMIPMMILGGGGDRKKEMAAKLYLESSLRKYPYVTIDCQVINERSLDEMTREIVKVVLSQCGGNQTLAAKKLGIGRTTL